MKKITYLVPLLLLLPHFSSAQNWQWGKMLTQPSNAQNYYYFNQSNPVANNLYVFCTNYNSTSNELRHFTGNGNNDWTMTFPPSLRILNMVADSLGNLIACGFYQDTLTLANTTFTAMGSKDAIFFKIDPLAQFLFVNTIVGPKDDITYSVAVNNMNEIYVATLLRDSMYTGANKILADTSGTETVIARYDPGGNLISAFKESNGQYHYGIDDIKMIIGNSGTIYFISNIAYYVGSSYAKVISSTGAVIGNMPINDGIYDIAIDSQENPYIIRNTGSHYSGEPMLLKCDQQLAIKWSQTLGGEYDTYCFTRIAIDNNNRLFLPGRNGNSYFGFAGSNTFGNQTFSYNGYNTMLLAEMDTAGNYINVTEHALKESSCLSALPDNQGNMYLINYYNYSDTTFMAGPDTVTFSTANPGYSVNYVLMKLGYGLPPLKINENNTISLVVSPNPSEGELKITYNGESSETTVVRILNSSGQLVYSDLIQREKLQGAMIDLGIHPKGIYILELTFGTSRITRKIVLD